MKFSCSILLLVSIFVQSRGKEIPRTKDSPIKYDLDPTRLPENTVAVENTEVVLRCAVADYTAMHSLQWWEYVYSGLGAPISENANVGNHPQRDRYSIITSGDGEYSLRISPVLMSDGGLYQCLDSWGNPTLKSRHSAYLTVIAPRPICNTTIPENGNVLDNAYHTNECSLRYKGGLIPNMTWSGIAPFRDLYVVTPDLVWAGMEYNVTRNMDTRSHICATFFSGYFLPVDRDTASNIPDYTYTHRERQMFVYWGPTSMYHEPQKDNYEVGDVLTCHADAFPPASYIWQNLRTTVITEGPTVTIDEEWLGQNQTMRCEARNVIAGFLFTGNYFTPVNVPIPTTATTTPTTPPTTLPPAVSNCFDLTGAWESNFPARASLCIRVNASNSGYLVGLARNHTDTFWVDIVGRATASSFDQVGFAGIWPLEMGVSSFVGECHRCFGIERILSHVTNRVRGSPCGVAGPERHTAQFEFYRSTTLRCPNLPE